MYGFPPSNPPDTCIPAVSGETMTTRRGLLGFVGATTALGLAGCLSGESGPDTSAPDSADCPDEPRVPEPGSGAEGDPPAIPSRPDSLAEDAVVEYAEEYEHAYVWRRKATEGTVHQFSLHAEPEVVWAGDEGVHVSFDPIIPHGQYEDEDGEEGHFGNTAYATSYLVTDEAVWRAEKVVGLDGEDDPPAPREDGELLACF